MPYKNPITLKCRKCEVSYETKSARNLGWCKKCYSTIQSAKWRQANLEKARACNRESYARHAEKRQEWRDENRDVIAYHNSRRKEENPNWWQDYYKENKTG